MNPSEAASMRQTLLDTHARLLAEGDAVVKLDMDEPVASAADEDEAPYREMGQAIASARNRDRARKLVQIEDALRRLAEDPEAFGECEGCNEPIPPRRLELMPFARLCAACQGAAETRGRSTRKRVTDFQ